MKSSILLGLLFFGFSSFGHVVWDESDSLSNAEKYRLHKINGPCVDFESIGSHGEHSPHIITPPESEFVKGRNGETYQVMQELHYIYSE